MIREAMEGDLEGLLSLYTYLHDNRLPELTGAIMKLWQRIIGDEGHHVIIAEVDGEIVASCVCVIVPNLTHGQRPYALIENVVTHPAYRGRGFATACLNRARDIAIDAHCYKLMLLTGAKDEGTLSFYEKAGYNRRDKTAFIQWLS